MHTACGRFVKVCVLYTLFSIGVLARRAPADEWTIPPVQYRICAVVVRDTRVGTDDRGKSVRRDGPDERD